MWRLRVDQRAHALVTRRARHLRQAFVVDHVDSAARSLGAHNQVTQSRIVTATVDVDGTDRTRPLPQSADNGVKTVQRARISHDSDEYGARWRATQRSGIILGSS